MPLYNSTFVQPRGADLTQGACPKIVELFSCKKIESLFDTPMNGFELDEEAAILKNIMVRQWSAGKLTR